MKIQTNISYPVHQGVALSYYQAKGVNPNEEFSTWRGSTRTRKYLGVAFAASMLLLLILSAAFYSLKSGDRFDANDKEGQMFLLAISIGTVFMIACIVSMNLFEHWRTKRKAFKNMTMFSYDYEKFLEVIGATDKEMQRWSEHQIKQVCVATLEVERSKIETLKTKRGKSSRLEKLIAIYASMTSMGIRFDAADTYIRYVRNLTRPKPKTAKTTTSKTKRARKSKKKIVSEPAA